MLISCKLRTEGEGVAKGKQKKRRDSKQSSPAEPFPGSPYRAPKNQKKPKGALPQLGFAQCKLPKTKKTKEERGQASGEGEGGKKSRLKGERRMDPVQDYHLSKKC